MKDGDIISEQKKSVFSNRGFVLFLKIALIILGVAALATIGGYLYKMLSSPKDTFTESENDNMKFQIRIGKLEQSDQINSEAVVNFIYKKDTEILNPLIKATNHDFEEKILSFKTSTDNVMVTDSYGLKDKNDKSVSIVHIKVDTDEKSASETGKSYKKDLDGDKNEKPKRKEEGKENSKEKKVEKSSNSEESSKEQDKEKGKKKDATGKKEKTAETDEDTANLNKKKRRKSDESSSDDNDEDLAVVSSVVKNIERQTTGKESVSSIAFPTLSSKYLNRPQARLNAALISVLYKSGMSGNSEKKSEKKPTYCLVVRDRKTFKTCSSELEKIAKVYDTTKKDSSKSNDSKA